MRNKTPKFSIADEFEAARASIRGQQSTFIGLRSFKAGPPAKVYRLAGTFARHSAYKNIVLPNPFPRKMSQISRVSIGLTGEFMNEFAWTASLLKAYAPEIGAFCVLKEQVESEFLLGNVARVATLLDQIEESFGQSAWLVESRLNYWELSASGQANRNRYTQSIRQAAPSPLFSYVVSWIAYRTGAGVSAGEVERLMDEFLQQPHPLYDLVFALNGRYPNVDLSKAAEMLNMSDQFPLVDRYHITLLVLQCLIASASADRSILEFTQAIVGDLSKYFSDIQFCRIARSLGLPVDVPVDRSLIRLLDDPNTSDAVASGLTTDEFRSCNSVEELELTLRLQSSTLEREAATQAIEESTRYLFDEIKGDLRAVILYSDDGVEARQRLQKIILTYSNSSWSASLRLILERHVHDERVLEPTPLQTVLGLRSAAEHPYLILTLPAGLARDMALRQYLLKYPTSFTVKKILALCRGGNRSVQDQVQSIDLALILLRRKAIDDAVLVLNELIEGRYPDAIQLEAARLLATALWLDQRIPEMTDLSARLYVRSRYFGAILPIQELVSHLLQWHDLSFSDSPTRGRLSVAIVFDVFSRYVSSERLAERADAFKDVLRANGVRKASELDTLRDRFAIPELVYFLRFVCVPDVLDQSLALESSLAVEDERVAILLLISELTEAKAPTAIKDELREIRTKQVVRDTTLRLDQSKIYVNVEGIRRSIDVSMRDDWNRYRLMSDGIEQTLFGLLEQVRNEKADPLTIIVANPSERFSLLKRMIQILRDEFTMNKEFGLNSNLSTNIRHGYVEREIRGPLLARSLITNKDADTVSYLKNKFWLEKVSDDETVANFLSDVFDKFSAGIDDQIDRLNRQLLRIRSDATPEGLFNYSLSDTAIMAVDAIWSSKETFDEFLDAVFSVFWENTQRNLAQVRATLTSSVLSALIDRMDEFAQQASTNGLDRLLPDLEHAITLAQTEMRSAVDRVASWFTLSSNNEYQDFDLAIAFQAAMNTVKTYFRNITITEEYISGREIVISGWCLPIFVRLFFLVLDNAATHGARNRNSLKLSISVEKSDTTLFIRAINDLSEDHDMAELKRRIDEINRDYGQARAMELLAEEGGSGYPKIWKLLKTDLRKDHILSVSTFDQQFCVDILLPTGGIVNETPDS